MTFFYAISLALAVSLVLLGGLLFDLSDLTWALISVIICTELDITQTKNLVIQRMFLTMLGVAFGMGVLLLFGCNFYTLFVGVILIMLVCRHTTFLANNWKFTTATAMVILVIAAQEHSLRLAEIIAIKRAVEVSAGSIIAVYDITFNS